MTLSKNNKHWHRYIWCQTSWDFTATSKSAHIRICCVWGNTSLLSLLPAWGDCYLDKIPFKHPGFCLPPANRTNQFLAEEEYLQHFSAVWLHSRVSYQLSHYPTSITDYRKLVRFFIRVRLHFSVLPHKSEKRNIGNVSSLCDRLFIRLPQSALHIFGLTGSGFRY